MSDLISTPSRAQSPVSSEAFEALIDLLASDGIDEGPSKLVGNQTNVTLRDRSGRLDFGKIRTMFAAQNEGHAYEDGDGGDEHQSSESVVPSPRPVERLPAGHRRSSTFGDQPWAAIHQNAVKVEDVAPTHSRQPLSLDELNAALAGAHEEVRSLRQQYDQLRGLVAKRLGAEAKPTDKDKRDATPSANAPPLLPCEITELSEDEAKRALSILVNSLNLSPSALTSLPSPSQPQSLFPPNPARQHDIASIARALKFLGTVDELVWRRASSSSGPRTLLPVYSEENIVALVARLELWERAVRRSSRT